MVNGVVQNPRDFLRAVPAELEMTPCLWWRKAPKSIPLLDLSLILASLYCEGGENVGEHCQEGRHGGGEGIDEGSSMYMERRFRFSLSSTCVFAFMSQRRLRSLCLCVVTSWCCNDDMFCLCLALYATKFQLHYPILQKPCWHWFCGLTFLHTLRCEH